MVTTRTTPWTGPILAFDCWYSPAGPLRRIPSQRKTSEKCIMVGRLSVSLAFALSFSLIPQQGKRIVQTVPRTHYLFFAETRATYLVPLIVGTLIRGVAHQSLMRFMWKRKHFLIFQILGSMSIKQLHSRDISPRSVWVIVISHHKD